ncbi:hypothetical protein FLX56_20910 [Synechococcus moorigangaii CMS01]|nr:hypothetical protein [Synechococcus moorigangaii CMS01]
MSTTSMSPRKTGTIFCLSALLSSAAIAPFAAVVPAQAQLFPGQQTQGQDYGRTVTIRQGATIPVIYPDAERVLVSTEETLDLTVEVAANLTDRNGQILIRRGTLIEGQIRPVRDGSQFIAERLVFPNNDTQEIYAESRVNNRTENINQGADAGDILEGAAIGAGAAAVIALITGDRGIDFGEILIGGGLGALGGWILGGNSDAEVIAFDSDRDLNLTLTSALSLEPYAYYTP